MLLLKRTFKSEQEMKLFLNKFENVPGVLCIELDIDAEIEAQKKALDKALSDSGLSESFKKSLLYSKVCQRAMDRLCDLEIDDLVLLMKTFDMKEKPSHSSSAKAESLTERNTALISFENSKNPSLLSLYNDSLKKTYVKPQPQAEKIIPKHQAKGFKKTQKPLHQPRR